MNGMQLQNKTAVITGASRGLGLRIAQTFFHQGAKLILIARSEKDLANIQADLAGNNKERVTILTADLSDPVSVTTLVTTLSSFTIDILINNAATQGPIGPVWENDWQHWQATLQTNLLAPISLCRALIPKMIKSGSGKIVNISGGGATSPRPNFSAYAIAKTALVRFSETLAEETKTLGIHVNCIAPGIMPTQMLASILKAGAQKSGANEYEKASAHQHASSHVLQDAAELCAFLASSMSDGITGKLISARFDPWQKLMDLKEPLSHSDIYTLRRIVPNDRGFNWDDIV